MSEIAQEVRHAWRTLRKRPLFTIVAAASIAIGVGANTAVFGVLNALLLRAPAGIAEPERVVEIGRTNRGSGFDSFSFIEVEDIRAQSGGVFSHVAAWRQGPFSVSAGEGGERAFGMAVSADYFGALGARPAAGRFFLPEEDRTPGTHPVVVISHGYWRDRMKADPAVIGSTISLNRRNFTVIGVTEPGFASHMPLVASELYIPMRMLPVMQPGWNSWETRWASSMSAIGRLADGVTIEQANAALETIFQRMAELDPDLYVESQRSAAALPLGAVPGAGRTPIGAFLGIIAGLVGLILLITCANVAGMLVARAAAREKEFALRLAIGAGRGRLIRQLLTESLLLFAIGGAAGVLLAVWGANALSAVELPVPVPLDFDFAPDVRVLLFGLAITFGTGLLFGLAPAMQSTRPALMGTLKNESANSRSSGGRMRRIFVNGQVALSLLMLIAAGLFLRALDRAGSVTTGIDTSDVHTVAFDLAIDGYDRDEGTRFLDRLLETVEALPGVTSAGAITNLPLDMGVRESSLYPDDWRDRGENNYVQVSYNSASPRYLETLDIPLLRGRGFNAQDGADAPRVVIVNRELAERVWPGADPIGEQVRFDGEGETMTVIGVVETVQEKMLMDAPAPQVYLPIAQEYAGDLFLVVESTTDRAATATAIRQAMRRADPNLSFGAVETLEAVTSVGTLPQRIAATVTSTLGLLALLLSAIGIYGVIAFTVTQRTREIGVRIAVGAHRGDVVRLIVRGAFKLAAPGLVIGLLAALGLGQLVRAFILGVPATDPVTFLAVPAVLLAVVMLASWAPARRAAAIEPLKALRAE